MWFRSDGPERIKARLHRHTRVTIKGVTFTIRQINPLLDFPSDKIPSLFTDFQSKRGTPPPPQDNAKQTIEKMTEDMRLVIQAGLVAPRLGDTAGGGSLTMDDLFRDLDVAVQLYYAIWDHSTRRLRGLKGLFFSIVVKLLPSILWLRSMGGLPRNSSTQKEISA